ncbi:MAG: SDR family oxidoreductase [Gemmataceae bacterium]
MSHSLKPVRQQVIVITGASSGIGLETARLAAEKGAKLVLAARSEHALQEIVQQINAGGGEAIAVGCDVADRAQVQRIADAAVARFGRIDTWVNNAGLGMYGRLDQVGDADNRRLFDINFWGVVSGSLVALPHLKQNGGALINIGSEVSDAYMPLLGMYSATKHAVKGFTDALRVEVEELDKAPVSITLIQPTATNTPFPQHARNCMDKEAKLPTPMIDPRKVAEAILDAAARPTRDRKVGALSKVNTLVAKIAPSLGNKMSAKQAKRLHRDEPAQNPEGALYRPSEATGIVGRTHGVGSGAG